MIQSNNKHANTCVVSNDEAVSTCKAMAFFMDRFVSGSVSVRVLG